MRDVNFKFLFLQDFVELFRKTFIHGWNDAVHVFYDRNFSPQSLIDLPQFQTNDTTSNNDQMLGNFRKL